MDIKTLESFSLQDAVTFHDKLNPKLFDGQHLKADVSKQLRLIAQDFIEELGIKGLHVKDITISGSNAAYSYTPHSDLDLHLIVDMSKLSDDEVYKELFTAKKTLYNDKHDISVYKIPVELYVQDSNQPHVSLGEYSILNDKWIKFPTKRRANFDQTATKAKYDKLMELIKHGLKSVNITRVKNIIDTIKRYRQAGLDKGGEFGPENLAFKAVRSQGLVTKLYALRDKLHSDTLSIESMYENQLLDKPTPTVTQLAVKHKVTRQHLAAQLDTGIKSELEHTSHRDIAREIALDHLGEDPNYYTKLKNANLEEGVAPAIIVYHGNQGGIDEKNLITPMWFTECKEDAVSYATQNDGAGWLLTCKLSCKKPYMVKDKESVHDVLEKYKSLLKFGYDAIYDSGDWIPFNNSDIKVLNQEYLDSNDVLEEDEDPEPELVEGRPKKPYKLPKLRADTDHLIYVVTNNAVKPKQYYIGITGTGYEGDWERTLAQRMRKHVQRAMAEKKDWGLCNSIRKYGADAHTIELLDVVPKKGPAHSREVELIGQTNPELNTARKKTAEDASGYIPSNAEKNDPRFSTALTVDVKPDTLKKNAKAFGSKVSRAGIPPLLSFEDIQRAVFTNKIDEQYYIASLNGQIPHEIWCTLMVEHFFNKDTFLSESLNQNVLAQVQTLQKESCSDLVVRQKYIPIPIILVGSEVKILDVEGNFPPRVPAKFCTLSDISEDKLTFSVDSSRIITYPYDRLENLTYMSTIVLDSIEKYELFRTTISLMFDVELPAFSQHTIKP